MDRRSFLAGTAAAMTGAAMTARPHQADAGPSVLAPGLVPADLGLGGVRHRTIRLWPDVPPGGGGPRGPRKISARGAMTGIATPTVDLYLPPRPNGSAMLIAAGGGYKRIETGAEAIPAARWLVRRGIIAAVLSYRLPREGWTAGPLAPLQDAQRALRLLRGGMFSDAVNSDRVGLMGFSAGGHLMAMTAARPEFRSYPPVDDRDELRASATALALAYPVVTLMPPYDKTATRISLVGQHPSRAESALWSVETHVTPAFPPTFVIGAADDTVVDPQNGVILERACANAGVAIERHLLPTGGHGFGMGIAGTPSEAWPALLERWLSGQGMLPDRPATEDDGIAPPLLYQP